MHMVYVLVWKYTGVWCSKLSSGHCSITGSPCIKHPSLYVYARDNCKTRAVVTQDPGGAMRPVGLFSWQYFKQVQGMSKCLLALDVCALVTEISKDLICDTQLFNTLTLLLKEKKGRRAPNSRPIVIGFLSGNQICALTSACHLHKNVHETLCCRQYTNAKDNYICTYPATQWKMSYI